MGLAEKRFDETAVMSEERIGRALQTRIHKPDEKSFLRVK